MAQGTKQVKVVSAAQPVPGQDFETTAFFDENGDPIDIGGGSPDPIEVGIDDVEGLADALAGKASKVNQGQASMLEEGTDTAGRPWSAKDIADYVQAQIATAIGAGE